jgi:hypothetical protein
MLTAVNPIRTSLSRQVNHWLQAATRLSSLDHLASGYAWEGVDSKMVTSLKQSLQKSIDEVVVLAKTLAKQLKGDLDEASLRSARRMLTELREKYLRVEETIHFYVVAINSRTTPHVSALLRACDVMCFKSMQEILQPLGKETPSVLTYVDKGIGASILKAGLRLWDGNLSKLAAIKVTQHNLFRPTAIIHETGHQVAHILNWNDELANQLQVGLKNHSEEVGQAFSNWSSEIAADAFAFVHTGYAAVAALHDVLSGTPLSVFAYHRSDPHPICYVRVMMGIEMCRLLYGRGAWDDLEVAFKNDYDIRLVNFSSVKLIQECTAALPDAVRIILKFPYRGFNGKSICDLIDPQRVSPQSLQQLETQAGAALFTSHAWIWKECIRLLALVGYKIGLGDGELSQLYKIQEDWMMKLGFTAELN